MGNRKTKKTSLLAKLKKNLVVSSYYLRVLNISDFLRLLKGHFLRKTFIKKMQSPYYKHPFYLRVPTSDISTYWQIFKDEEYNFDLNISPKVIIDAGANIGLASIYFANKFPEAKIISLEPEKSNFELLSENVKYYTNIIPIQNALWHKNEVIELVDPGIGKWGFMTKASASENPLKSEFCHKVNAITVDKIISDFDLGKVDILKIDIEGAEKEVFSDTTSWINDVNIIIAELHERMKPGCNRSFYCGTQGFDNEWKNGENIYLSRKDYHLSKNQ